MHLPDPNPSPTGAASHLRSAPRFAYRAVCEVEFAGLGAVALECLDIGVAGAFFATPVAPEEGTRVRCAVPLPGGREWLVDGRVVRVSLGIDERNVGIAVAFDGATNGRRRQLSALLALDPAPPPSTQPPTSRVFPPRPFPSPAT